MTKWKVAGAWLFAIALIASQVIQVREVRRLRTEIRAAREEISAAEHSAPLGTDVLTDFDLSNEVRQAKTAAESAFAAASDAHSSADDLSSEIDDVKAQLLLIDAAIEDRCR